jgi:hypothetical protein
MSLNRVLELSEANMNEGDYLEVANILRDIHNNTPPTPPPFLQKTFIFNETYLLCENISCQCSGNKCGIKMFFKSIKFERNNPNHNYWEPREVNINDNIIKWSRFENMLNTQLKSTMSLVITFFNDGEAENMDFDFKEYVEFFTRRYEIRYGEDDDNLIDEEDMYNAYIRLIVSQIKDYLLSLKHNID